MKFAEFSANTTAWKEKGFAVPTYDRNEMIKATKEAPEWVHFGCGNIFRAFTARLCEDLLNKGMVKTGILTAEGFDEEIVTKAFKPFDDMSVAVTLKADGSIEKQIIGSVADSYILDSTLNDWNELKKAFEATTLKMASFTITEKGYSLKNAKGEFAPAVEADLNNGPAAPVSYMGKVAALLLHRYENGATPVALVSMDNCSHNGDKLKAAIAEFAAKWEAAGVAAKGFTDYINDPVKGVAFPISMIDKITPRPDAGVKNMLEECGFEDTDIIVTSKGSYTAPFVNAEEAEYLIMEDLFPNGKIPLDKISAGVKYTDRETVDRVERMKVCTCLNPLHTALAVFGCLLGYTKISEEMKDEELKALVNKVGYEEGLPVVVDPGIISPKAFIDEVVNKRIPNPFMPDTPQRIATDTSQKLAIRFGQTVKAYQEKEGLDHHSLKMIPAIFAGWCRYLMGIDDDGNKFEVSPDPMLEAVVPYVDGLTLSENTEGYGEKIRPILQNTTIFGLDLYAAGMGEKIEKLFEDMCKGKGAVRATLKNCING